MQKEELDKIMEQVKNIVTAKLGASAQILIDATAAELNRTLASLVSFLEKQMTLDKHAPSEAKVETDASH